jgi:hypothetical protein
MTTAPDPPSTVGLVSPPLPPAAVIVTAGTPDGTVNEYDGVVALFGVANVHVTSPGFPVVPGTPPAAVQGSAETAIDAPPAPATAATSMTTSTRTTRRSM